MSGCPASPGSEGRHPDASARRGAAPRERRVSGCPAPELWMGPWGVVGVSGVGPPGDLAVSGP